jgi:hypothetical protein
LCGFAGIIGHDQQTGGGKPVDVLLSDAHHVIAFAVVRLN